MVNILFGLIGMVVLDHILAQNRRARRPYYPPYFREDIPYSPPPYEGRYRQDTNSFSHYSRHFRHDLANSSPNERIQSPIVSTLIFVAILIGLFYFLRH